MTLYSNILVYPEGDQCETDRTPFFNELVDLNGFPLQIPLKTEKTIVYRVYKISTQETRGEVITFFHLELVTGNELFSLVKK